MKKGLYGLLAGILLLGSTGCSDYVKRDEVAKDYVKKEEVSANYVRKDNLEDYINSAFKRKFPDAVDGKYDFNGSFVDWNKFDISELVKAKQTVEVEVIYEVDINDNPRVFLGLTLEDMGAKNGIVRGRLDSFIEMLKSNKELRESFKGNELYKKGDGYFFKSKLPGIATGVFDKYLFTLDHIANAVLETLPLPVMSFMGVPYQLPNGEPIVMRVPIKEVSRKYDLLVGKERKKLTKLTSQSKVDVAVLKLKDSILTNPITSLPYKFGDSNELKLGNWVMVVGKPLQMDDNTRFGTVTNTYPLGVSKLPVGNSKNPPSAAEDVFMISSLVIPGDSGGLVLAAKDGNIEIVGFVEAVVEGANANIVTRSNRYLDVVLPAIVKDNPELAKTNEFKEFFGNYLKAKDEGLKK
ncbi:trypsin-like peptidase domain-containing protein [Candidatus Woesearchaeota archaeon]|nr:trypsin-like peptidase domain-containing protein [Candidatus Woesearchaeota archaeon]